MIWYFLPRVLSAVIAVLTISVLSRLLQPADFGQYNFSIILGTAGFAFVFAWLVASISRYHASDQIEGNTVAVALGIAFWLFAGFAGVIGLLYFLPSESHGVTLFQAASFCLAHAVFEIGLMCLRVQNEGPKYAILALLRPIGALVLIWFIVRDGYGVGGAIFAMVAAAAVTGIAALIVAIRNSGVTKPRLVPARRLFTYGLPLAIVSSSTTLYLLASQSYLAALVSLEAVGFLAAANTLSMRTLRMPLASLMNAIAPSIYRAHEEKGQAESDRQLAKLFSMLMLFALPIGLTLLFVSRPITFLLFPESFALDVIPIMRILVIATFIASLQGAYFSFAFSRTGRTDLQFWIMIANLAVHALGSLILIALFDLAGAAYGFLFSSLFGLSAYLVVGRRIDLVKVPMAEVRKALIGAASFVPFGLFAGQAGELWLSIGVTILGVVVMFGVLAATGQQAATMIITQIRKKLT